LGLVEMSNKMFADAISFDWRTAANPACTLLLSKQTGIGSDTISHSALAYSVEQSDGFTVAPGETLT
jgi:hypothetical protein